MAGRISEYLTLSGKITGTELVDVSAVDAGSPTGYSTRKTTVADLANFNPTIYTGDSTIVNGNRTVDQDSYQLSFNNGDFGIDDGLFFEDLTKRIGIGTQSPSSTLHIKGQSGDDLLYIEDSTGSNALIVKDSKRVGINNNTPSGTFHVKSLDGSGSFIDGDSTSASEFILRLADGTNTVLNQFRNSGRVDLATNGSEVVLGSSGGTNYQFHQWSPTNPNSGLPVHVVQVGSNIRFWVLANGGVRMDGLPTSNAGLVSGDLWRDGNDVKIV